jgi:outer membrane murein-binding lipoprotein Lpp
MAGVDFNREVFAKTSEPPPRPAQRGAGFVILAVVLGVLAVLGYKILSESRLLPADHAAGNLGQMQEQIAEIEKRVAQLEKRHKAAVTEAAATHPKNEATRISDALPRARPSYQISSASILKPQGNSVPLSLPATPSAPAPTANAPSKTDNSSANREVWEATANRLADVVQAVGEQQGQLSETRDTVNQLLAQTHRTALSFELHRSAARMPVGPVSLLLKSVDFRTQRYSVCVYLETRCIELKDRAVNEVVVFAPAKDSPPLELLVTKVSRGEIVGYLEVPDTKPR